MKKTWIRKEAAEITGLPDRRVLFYTEQDILPDFIAPVGRGTAREYSLKHLFFLAVIKELDSLGLSLARIKPIITTLYVKTMHLSDAPATSLIGKSIWIDGTFTKEPVIMVVSLPQSPEEHALSPDSKSYDNEIFMSFPEGSTKIKILAERPSNIVLNLNKIFSSLKIKRG